MGVPFATSASTRLTVSSVRVELRCNFRVARIVVVARIKRFSIFSPASNTSSDRIIYLNFQWWSVSNRNQARLRTLAASSRIHGVLYKVCAEDVEGGRRSLRMGIIDRLFAQHTLPEPLYLIWPSSDVPATWRRVKEWTKGSYDIDPATDLQRLWTGIYVFKRGTGHFSRNAATRFPNTARGVARQRRTSSRWRGYNRNESQGATITCSACGKQTTVPFEPRGDRPVYCPDCFRFSRRDSGGPGRSQARPLECEAFDKNSCESGVWTHPPQTDDYIRFPRIAFDHREINVLAVNICSYRGCKLTPDRRIRSGFLACSAFPPYSQSTPN